MLRTSRRGPGHIAAGLTLVGCGSVGPLSHNGPVTGPVTHDRSGELFARANSLFHGAPLSAFEHEVQASLSFRIVYSSPEARIYSWGS